MSKAKKYGRWQDLKRKTFSDAQLREIRLMVEQEKREMDLRALRELLGLTQKEMAERLHQTQGHVSTLERRRDFKVSTLVRYIRELGGECEISAKFGKERIPLAGLLKHAMVARQKEEKPT